MLNRPSEKRSHIKYILTPRNPLEFVGFVGITALISWVSSGNVWGVAGVCLVGFIWWLLE